MGRYGPLLADSGIPVHCLRLVSSRPSTYARLGNLLRLIRSLAPDVIQGWMYHGNLAAWLAHKALDSKPRLAWNIRHSLYDPKLEPLRTRMAIESGKHLSGAPRVILYNSHVSRVLHERWGFCPRHGHVIPNGFDVSRDDAIDVASMRAALGLPADAFVFGHFARDNPVKDHASFLKAATAIAARHSEVYFLAAGAGITASNERLMANIPPSLSARIMLLGEREDVPALMRICDAVVSSSYSEAFPNVLGEAMASGVPCIATDVGDCAYLIGDTGLLVPPRDTVAMAAAMQTMIDYPEQTRTWGKLARERVSANFSLHSVVEQYAALYNGELV